eukprot:SAG11_NODE_12262_length_712_cov_1.189233_1_plen_23_part_01
MLKDAIEETDDIDETDVGHACFF